MSDCYRRFAVPGWGDSPDSPLARHYSCRRGRQLARIGPDEFVRPDRDSLGTLDIVAECQARHAWHGGLLGNAIAPRLSIV